MGVCDEKILRKTRTTPKNRNTSYGSSISSKYSRDFISETDKNSIFAKNIFNTQSKDYTNSLNITPNFKNSNNSQRNIIPKFEEEDKSFKNNLFAYNQAENNEKKEDFYNFNDKKDNSFKPSNLYDYKTRKIFEDCDIQFNTKKNILNKYPKRESNTTNIKLIKNKEQEPVKINYNFHDENNYNKLNYNNYLNTVTNITEENYNELFTLNNFNNKEKRNNILYIIDDKKYPSDNINNTNNIMQYSTEKEYLEKISCNMNNKKKLSLGILLLKERNWYKELIDLSNILICHREQLDNKIFNIYLRKIVKIYGDFNWLTDSIATFCNNILYKNEKYNEEILRQINLPKIDSNEWYNGFKWKGVFIKAHNEISNSSGKLINEIKALNYFFFDFLQIIGKYQIKKPNQLSNHIIFPLINYSKINGIILSVSALINVDNINNKQLLLNNIINNNGGIINYYSNFKEGNFNENTINMNYQENKNLKATLGEKFYIEDLVSSKLFSAVNNNHLIEISGGKFLIFNLHEFIPNLFEKKYESIQKINFFSIIKHKKVYYTLNYDIRLKSNINGNLSKFKTPKEVLENLYNMNSKNLKTKDIIINKMHFRIIYENNLEIINENHKSNSMKNFINHLFYYSENNTNYNISSYIIEPYVIIYDLIDPLKLKYSLIKIPKNDEINNVLEDKLYYISTNYFQYFISWCDSLNKNSYNIKKYDDLKHSMKKYGINTQLLFFSLLNIKNPDIADIIKISLLVKAIKFVFNYKNLQIKNINILSLQNRRKILLLYFMQCILYPNKILQTQKNLFEYIYENLVFYMDILFLKQKLIDDYLNLGILNLNNIFDHYLNNNNLIKSIDNENLIRLLSKKFTGFNSPKDFLKHLIETARKKPFIFINELEIKLNFIINPFIKFKASLSLESLSNFFDNENIITLNDSHKTFSYIKSKELSGLVLTKLIKCYNSFNLDNSNIFEDYQNNNKDNLSNDIKFTKNSDNKNNITQNGFGTKMKNNNFDQTNDAIITGNESHESTNANILASPNEDNITYISDISRENVSEFLSEKNNKKNIISGNLSNKNQKVFWSDIKNELLFELPDICYKMSIISEDKENENKHYKNKTIYKNLKNVYNIIDQQIFTDWYNSNELIFHKIYSCNGESEHTLLLSLFYLLIIYFFIDKNLNEYNKYLEKINYIYHHGGYQLSLNELAIINLFQALGCENYVKSEESYSKCLMLFLMEYGDPRGRFNDSHGCLQYPLWKIARKTLKLEIAYINENFKEMYHALDYFEKKNCTFKNEYKNDECFDFCENINNNIDKVFKMNCINNYNKKNIKFENYLSLSIFIDKILNLQKSNYFKFPGINQSNDKCKKIIYTKEYIIYFIKQIQSLLIGTHLIFNEEYINKEISSEIFSPYEKKEIKFPQNDNSIYNNNLKIRNSVDKKFSSKRSSSTASNSHSKKSIFSHFLYNELLEKLSYKKNIPSGIVISFGNNKHNETSQDKIEKVTLPRLIYKLKNEYINRIYSGWEHNIIINNKGEIFSFGHNQNFQCGLPNTSQNKSIIKDPQNISKINNDLKAISAACGNEHSLILTNENIVYSCGNNEDGVLGLNDKKIKSYILNKVYFGIYTNRIISISAGTVHNLALTNDGKIFSWGSSQGGQLGICENDLLKKPDIKENYSISEPTLIKIKNEKKNFNNENIIVNKISCGEAHSVILSNDGEVYSWGFGSNGQLGLGFCEDSFKPGTGLMNSRIFTPKKINKLENEKIIDIQCGKTFTMFINDKNEILGCGVNDLYQLGTKENLNKSHLYNNEIICYDFVYPMKLDCLAGMKVESISCGEGHCLAIIKEPHAVWSWGNNNFGQLGHGYRVKVCLPTPINYLLVYNNKKYDSVSCGGFHSLCLIKHKGNLSWLEDDLKDIIDEIDKNVDFI